jgi:hypothetical protein
MKWKCFRRSLNYRLEPNHYKDPVLIAYWNALRADTLCAWRRVLTDDGQKTEKELWLFGINEDLPSKIINLRRKMKIKRKDFQMNLFFQRLIKQMVHGVKMLCHMIVDQCYLKHYII